MGIYIWFLVFYRKSQLSAYLIFGEYSDKVLCSGVRQHGRAGAKSTKASQIMCIGESERRTDEQKNRLAYVRLGRSVKCLFSIQKYRVEATFYRVSLGEFQDVPVPALARKATLQALSSLLVLETIILSRFSRHYSSKMDHKSRLQYPYESTILSTV